MPRLKNLVKTINLPSFIAFLREYIILILIEGSRLDSHSLNPFRFSQNQTVECN